MRALRWPASLCLPALDILRLTVLNPKANEVLFQKSIFEDLFSLLLISVKSNNNDNCLMLAIRTIANMFSNKKGMYCCTYFVMHRHSRRALIIFKTFNKHGYGS